MPELPDLSLLSHAEKDALIRALWEALQASERRNAELTARLSAAERRIAELEARLNEPPKRPDNSSLPPSRGQKSNRPPKARARGHAKVVSAVRAGVARLLKIPTRR